MSYTKIECGKLIKYCNEKIDVIIDEAKKEKWKWIEEEYKRQNKLYGSQISKIYRKFFKMRPPYICDIEKRYDVLVTYHSYLHEYDCCLSLITLAKSSSSGYVYISREDWDTIR